MNNNILKVALGVSLTIAAFSASAQKNYTEGVVSYTTTSPAGNAESKISFRGDSSLTVLQTGPAVIKLITTVKHSYFAILVDVPVASMKKAAVLTPDEVDQASDELPKLTFTPTTETKQISGYNCKKVTAKDAKSGSDIEVWVTNDISAPANTVSMPFVSAGGFPVEVITTLQGQKADITLKSITEQKVPAGAFGVPAGYDKITYDELKAMRGGK
ncbi:MAG TPA: DUF4412 domain-containing protein [Mucilaginibacter sp.]